MFGSVRAVQRAGRWGLPGWLAGSRPCCSSLRAFERAWLPAALRFRRFVSMLAS